MELFVEVRKQTYLDSVLALLAASVFNDQDGVEKANVAMGTEANKSIFASLGMENEAIQSASDADLIIAMYAESREVFEKVLPKLDEVISPEGSGEEKKIYITAEQAYQEHPESNLALISVPGEYARTETEKALNAGKHVILFSAGVSGEDELAMKTLAKEKGLLCMGPDCGVVNLNGIAYVLASINNRGPFGVVAASGCGLQHAAAQLQHFGSGISQGIGTGGGDLKAPVYGITMLMGIDALEADPETEYIIVVSRKPNEISMERVLNRVKECKKPVIVHFMGCEREPIEAAGAIYAESLDDIAVQAMKLLGKEVSIIDEETLDRMADDAAEGMGPGQKYLRGLFEGGTYTDEAIGVLEKNIGLIHSNVSSDPERRLADSLVSVGNTCIDYGEEEFTQGRPHPTLMPEVRSPHIAREAADPEVAVLLFDFIFSAASPKDIVSGHVAEFVKAREKAKAEGRKLVAVASILGTDTDIQGYDGQKKILEDAGVYVCPTNYTAARLAAKIISRINGGK